MSMKGLARQLKVDPSFLSRIERGIVAAPVQLVRELSKALGTIEDPLLVLAGHLPEDRCLPLPMRSRSDPSFRTHRVV